jgi:hypothetical protein
VNWCIKVKIQVHLHTHTCTHPDGADDGELQRNLSVGRGASNPRQVRRLRLSSRHLAADLLLDIGIIEGDVELAEFPGSVGDRRVDFAPPWTAKDGA